MNVLDLLKQDHQTVAKLIDEVENAEAGDKRLESLGQQIAQALTVHAALEEKLFYPVLRDRAEDDEELVDVFEAFTEHDVVKHLISLLKGRRRSNAALFKAELQVLGENVKHHVREEESTIFSLARELLDEGELEKIGERAEAQKRRLMGATSPASSRKKSTSARKKGAKKTSTRKGGRRKSR